VGRSPAADLPAAAGEEAGFYASRETVPLNRLDRHACCRELYRRLPEAAEQRQKPQNVYAKDSMDWFAEQG
jgi:hypothetical protein